MGRLNPSALVLAMLVAGLQAQSPHPGGALDRKDLDALLDRTLKDVINKGVALYNAGEHGACYRLYQGSLTTVKPLLEHRSELQKKIDESLTAAERDPVTWRRAFALRAALDKVRTDLKSEPKEKAKEEEKIPPPIVVEDKDKKEDKKEEKKDTPKEEKNKKQEEKPADKDNKGSSKEEDKKGKDDLSAALRMVGTK